MATGSSRDVRLNLAVGVTGEDDVGSLADSLRDIGKAGGDAAPEARRLADALDSTAAATKKARDSERALSQEYGQQRAALQQRVDALKRSNLEADAARRNSEAFKAAQRAEKVAIHDAGVALRTKAEATKAASAEARRAAAAEKAVADQARTLVKETRAAEKGIKGVGNAAGDAAGMLRQLAPMLATAFGVQEVGAAVIANEQLVLSYESIFGSAERAAQEMRFVRDAANRLGVESQVLARSYQSLAAATKGTALEGEQTRQVFEATAKAMAVLGKSSAQTDQALTAISQMASKGTVSMEELRGQLGEALPGAMQAAAKGAGLTVEELIAMVETGSVLAKDLLPALTRGLSDLYANAAPPKTIISEWARLKNTIADTAVAIGDQGASSGAAKFLQVLSVGARATTYPMSQLGAAVTDTLNAIKTGTVDFSRTAGVVGKTIADLKGAAQDAGLLAKEQTQATQAQVRAIDNQAAANERQVESGLKVRAMYGDLAKGASEYSTAMSKALAARQAEAATLTSLVSIYGNEAEKRQAATDAAAMQARASKDLADARNAEAIIAQSYALRLREEALQRNDATEATRKQVQAAQQAADTKRAEADQAQAVARTRAVEVEAARAAAEAYRDNSARVYELRGAVAEAEREVRRLIEAQKLGKATDDDVTAARARAARATAVYRDALRDATSAAERRVSAERQTAQTVQSSIGVDIERANAMREVAEANGDATAATQAHRQSTMLQARAADESAASARREAQAIRDAADAREAELRATGQLTGEKTAEIEAARRSADLKDLEAQKADILAGKIRALADSETARTDALERSIATQEKALDLAERQLALENRRRGVDKSGFTLDKAGNSINAGGATRSSIVEFLKAAGVQDDATARRIANDFADSRGEIQFFNNPGQKKYGGDTLSMALLRAAETVTFGAGQQQAPTPTRAPVERSTAHRVEITLPNGERGSVNAASEADAKGLVDLLKRMKGVAA